MKNTFGNLPGGFCMGEKEKENTGAGIMIDGRGKRGCPMSEET